MTLKQNICNREKIISSLHEEMIGPTLDFSSAKKLASDTAESEKNGLFYYHEYASVKEEIHYGSPQRHYNSGMLYPLVSSLKEIDSEKDEELELIGNFDGKERNVENTIKEDEDTEISSAGELISENKFLPSTFGFTFAVHPDERDVAIKFTCGAYEQRIINPKIQTSKENWWFRKALSSNFLIALTNGSQKFEETLVDGKNVEYPKLKIRLDSLVREVKLKSTDKILKLVTISVTNITDTADEKDDTNLMFQCKITASELEKDFQPYPSAADLEAKIEEEDKKFDLLYSSEKNYGFGQNCSTTWKEKEHIVEMSTTFLPEYEIKTMSPDIEVNGEKIEVFHASLASARSYQELQSVLSPLVNGYKEWYAKLTKTVVLPYYQSVFQSNLSEIKTVIDRIERGMELLLQPDVFNAFRLTNLAMLMQMTTGKNNREILNDDGVLKFSENHINHFGTLKFSDFDSLSESVKLKVSTADNSSPWKKCKWRGFQIAFLLMSIESFVKKDSIDRSIVDLIWFPTGGGKTEAYLASATFSMIFRRLIEPSDCGTDVIMRYTLRLLTADQFQRSARLMCSIEFIRRQFTNLLGESELSLGMWVGRDNTPNNNTQARNEYNQILRGEKAQFPLSACPWCGAEMTVSKSGTYHGYKIANGLVAYCPDTACSFHDKLPIYFVDEQLYQTPPTFLIGTIDKFAQLTWVPDARSLFGINAKGQRVVSPPNLIIQDELHLISGPLGTLTGMYETLIEELCIDRRSLLNSVPKIICATATIKAYDEQIRSLFARENSGLFPPAGVDINDNYFSTVQKDVDGKNARGRKYVGIYPFTQGKLQTEVQTKSSLISSVQALPPSQRDPFWTILSFYNSINDIGKGLTLTDQDIPNSLKNFYNSRNVSKENRRYLRDVKELTSRLDSSRVGLAINEMKESYKEEKNKAIDIVLASNIIEVGVDINRLSLMTISGQPKTSAQYIQVSGRVGRKTDERPGLIITEYNPTNSNDKSHYEHFIEFHQRLYSQVEESSVTPFSRFAIERGLPAVIIGFLRQSFDKKQIGDSPNYQYLEEITPEINNFLNRLLARVKRVDDTEIEFLKSNASELLEKLLENDYDDWEFRGGKKANNGFMVRMTKDQEDIPETILPVMFSMRSVDATSRLAVVRLRESKGYNLSSINKDNDGNSASESISVKKSRWFK